MRRLPGKKLEIWQHPKYGVKVEIRLDSSDGEFVAFIGDNRYGSKVLEDLRKALKKAVEDVIYAFASSDMGETIDGSMATLEAQNLTDLLCDFGHYCDRNGISLQNCLRMAASNYNEETENVGTQFNEGDPMEAIYERAMEPVGLRIKEV